MACDMHKQPEAACMALHVSGILLASQQALLIMMSTVMIMTVQLPVCLSSGWDVNNGRLCQPLHSTRVWQQITSTEHA